MQNEALFACPCGDNISENYNLLFNYIIYVVKV